MRTLKLILAVSFFLIVMIIQGCERKNRNARNNPQELTFNVDHSLLEDKFSDKYLGFIFYPPKSCLQLPEEMVQKVKGQLKDEYTVPNSFVIEPYKFFLNEKDQSACLISILPTLSPVDSSIDEYQQAICNFSSNSQVTQDMFLHNGFRIYQSLIIRKDMILFKLVILQPLEKSFQIDYVIPKSIYRDNLEAIESSIGSVSKL